VPEAAVRDALLTHRSAYVGEVLNRDNLFYIPPQLLLEARGNLDGVKYGEWMCQQILRVIGAERARDEVFRALQESEAQQRQLTERLAVLNRDLEKRIAQRTAQLESANKHLEAFSYSISHDLRAPLRAIKGFSQVLVEDFSDKLGEEGRKNIDRIVAGATHMDSLIGSLLEMGRATAHFHPVPVDLTALAQEVIAQARTGAPQRVVDVTVAEGMRAVGDATLLRTVLTNLIENAFKFTSGRERARIAVGAAEREGDNLVFFVRDNGAGFDMQNAKRLFGVFQRLHRQDEFPGTGVGLATCSRIIEKHGGRIWAESRPNEGATFFFSLPQ
jgi:light-regulated signal transduction histidine kinase (bacteriophytochrome)